MASSSAVKFDDIDKHEFAQYILREHGTYFPKICTPLGETIPDLKERIDELQTQYSAELEKLGEYHAAQYFDDALDRYSAQDDEASDDYSGIIDELYDQFRRHGKTSLEARFDRETTLVRLAHTETVAPLLYKLAYKQREEESRKRREIQFPQTAAEFNFIQDKELQQRIARFLASDAIVQDKMLNEYGWAWRQVQGLKEEYLKDSTFKEDIQRRVAVVRDPRRKSTLT
ncbi:hypothetical protein F5148DRAFT_1209357 [Russula earlei]|uniref:Uncharacterized protein n=1 Tax=Russula earlei TaxID=71964 RepID=A0ACC0U5N9_9AGAM|nr:hypothetical protein F5148DRAFT_1209357 [Russula earlei]